MDDFTRVYREAYNDALFRYGFQKKGKRYYRLLNRRTLNSIWPQVEGDPYGSAFVLNYTIWPICAEPPTMATFRSDSFSREGWFPFLKSDPASIEKAVADSLVITLRDMLPIFDVSGDYAAYLDALDEYFLKSFGEVKEKGLGNESGLWLNIALKRYDKAKKSVDDTVERINEKIRFYAEENEKYKNNPKFKPNDLSMFQYPETFAIQKALETGDYDYLDRLVKRNEEQALEIISGKVNSPGSPIY